MLNENDYKQNYGCNCWDRTRCPLKGNCLIANMIYKANVKKEDYINNEEKSYIDSTELNRKINGITLNSALITENISTVQHCRNMNL